MSDPENKTSKRKNSYAKLFEATAIWAIVAAVMGWLVYKEISGKAIEIEQEKAGRKLIVETTNLHGIAARSPLVCQGLNVGKVTEVEARPDESDPEKLTIVIHAQLDARYSGWEFAPEATVGKSGVMGGITGTPITLSFAGKIPEEELPVDYSREEPQRIALKSPEDTGERLRSLLTEVETVVGAFTEEVPPPDGWPEGTPATRIDVLTANLASASEAIRGASEKLEMQMDAETDGSLMAGMNTIQTDLKDFTKNSNALISDVRNTVASIESRFDDTLGSSKAERARLRKEAEEVLSSLDTFVDRLDDLASRTGDTFLGRTLIRKSGDEPNEEPPEEIDAIDKRHRAGPRR